MAQRRTLIIAAVVLIAIVAAYLGLRAFVLSSAEQQLMTPYKNGTKTPASFGAPYSTLWIDSGGHKLEAYLVVAPQTCTDRVAVLVFHGRGEAISGWARAQAFLRSQCVSSLVFDYSGFGSSTPPAHIATLNNDAVAAYRVFAEKFPGLWRRCVLGHSMGNAPMLHTYPSFEPRPDCVVVANAFSSVEDMARASGAPALLVAVLHGVWDNTAAIKNVSTALLVIHSDADEAIPHVAQAHLDAAGPPNAQHILLHGFKHNALFRDPDLKWWAPVLAFLKTGRS